MKRILLTVMVMVAGLSAIAPDISAQSGNRNARDLKKQERMDAWHKDMAEFRARSAQDRMLNALADSLAYVQGKAALANRDFVFEAESVTFKNGTTAFVNSTTNFISLKGNKAVVQISPSNFASGPNGVGGVTVEGSVSGLEVKTSMLRLRFICIRIRTVRRQRFTLTSTPIRYGFRALSCLMRTQMSLKEAHYKTFNNR